MRLGRLLCWLGFHDFKFDGYFDGGDVSGGVWQCQRCPKRQGVSRHDGAVYDFRD